MGISYTAHISQNKSAITSKTKLEGVAKHNLRKYKSADYSADKIILLYGTNNLLRDVKRVYKEEFGNVLFFKLFTASCCTLFTTIFKIILNATSHYSSPIMHIKYCYPKRSTLF